MAENDLSHMIKTIIKESVFKQHGIGSVSNDWLFRATYLLPNVIDKQPPKILKTIIIGDSVVIRWFEPVHLFGVN